MIKIAFCLLYPIVNIDAIKRKAGKQKLTPPFGIYARGSGKGRLYFRFALLNFFVLSYIPC